MVAQDARARGYLGGSQARDPPAFDRIERTEAEVWQGFERASGDIERVLWLALDVLQGPHLRTENVSICPTTLVILRYMISRSRPSFRSG